MIWTLPSDAWPALAAQLELAPGAWSESVALLDLDWHRAELAAGRLSRLPGRSTFARRWGWKEHTARTFLERTRTLRSPALHQPTPAPVAGDPHPRGISDPGTTSSTTRSPSGSSPGALEEAGQGTVPTSGSPAPHQPGGVPTGGDQPGEGIGHSGTTSSATNAGAVNPPHTPPDLSLSTGVDLDHERQIPGGPGGRDPLALVPPELRVQAQAVPEVQAFLRVFLRWKSHPKAPHPWRTGTSEAVSWFLELVGADPTTVLGKAVAAVDLVGALQAWDAWLSDRVDEHGKPGTKGRSKFPKGWKNALRRWILNQHKFKRNLKPSAQRRRGAWGGKATSFTPRPASTTPTPGPDQARPATPCTPPGDPNALRDF